MVYSPTIGQPNLRKMKTKVVSGNSVMFGIAKIDRRPNSKIRREEVQKQKNSLFWYGDGATIHIDGGDY